MSFNLSWNFLIGLLFTLQLGGVQVGSADSKPETIGGKQLLALQTKVESLIEKIVRYIQEFYENFQTQMKCLPDGLAPSLIETLEESIICVDKNEKNYTQGLYVTKVRDKNFLKCFAKAKEDIKEKMSKIDISRNHCPEEVTEKTYQINVTTTFTKTFHINIKNGIKLTKKEIELSKDTDHCFHNNMNESSEDDGNGSADKAGKNATNEKTPKPSDESKETTEETTEESSGEPTKETSQESTEETSEEPLKNISDKPTEKLGSELSPYNAESAKPPPKESLEQPEKSSEGSVVSPDEQPEEGTESEKPGDVKEEGEEKGDDEEDEEEVDEEEDDVEKTRMGAPEDVESEKTLKTGLEDYRESYNEEEDYYDDKIYPESK